MKSTVQPAARPYLRGGFVNHPRRQESNVIAPVLDDGVMRIRLHRLVEEKGSLNGFPLTVETQSFLDGTILTKTLHEGRVRDQKRDTMATQAIPARTKDVVDFGRLSAAVQALAAEAQRYSADSPPTDAQLESLINSYQGILAWREKAAAALAEAEGKIDVAGALMRRVVGL